MPLRRAEKPTPPQLPSPPRRGRNEGLPRRRDKPCPPATFPRGRPSPAAPTEPPPAPARPRPTTGASVRGGNPRKPARPRPRRRPLQPSVTRHQRWPRGWASLSMPLVRLLRRPPPPLLPPAQRPTRRILRTLRRGVRLVVAASRSHRLACSPARSPTRIPPPPVPSRPRASSVRPLTSSASPLAFSSASSA